MIATHVFLHSALRAIKTSPTVLVSPTGLLIMAIGATGCILYDKAHS